MKPKKIVLIRHGESLGNVDGSIYESTPDYAVDLTDKGKEQALLAGQTLKKILPGTTRFYVSPFYRTRRTYDNLKLAFGHGYTFREDVRLREQGEI